MFVIMKSVLSENKSIPCKVATTKEKAEEWVKKEYTKLFNGAVYEIIELEVL